MAMMSLFIAVAGLAGRQHRDGKAVARFSTLFQLVLVLATCHRACQFIWLVVRNVHALVNGIGRVMCCVSVALHTRSEKLAKLSGIPHIADVLLNRLLFHLWPDVDAAGTNISTMLYSGCGFALLLSERHA